MKFDEIYFWALCVLSIILFTYAACNIPPQILDALRGTV